MFNFVPLGIVAMQAQQRAAQEAADHAADAFCYMAAHWRRVDPNTIDVEAREVPEPRLIGHAGAR
jgi:hypothetical protein